MSHDVTTPAMPGAGRGSHRLNLVEKRSLHQSGSSIRAALQNTPELAVGVYESELRNATSPLVQGRLRVVFEPHIEYARIGASIGEGARALPALANAYHGARRSDRRTLIKTATEALVRLGGHAYDDPASLKALRSIGEKMPLWVLEGTVQQQLICKLAVHLGATNEAPPRALADVLREQMIPALQTVIDVGAPATRDVAVEGLGAVLKILPEPKCLTPSRIEDDLGDPEINKRYHERRKRRYLFVNAIAGDRVLRRKYFSKLEAAPGSDLDERAAYLRALPAIWRQTAKKKDTVLRQYTSMLCEAAKLHRVDAERLGVTRAAFARFQESVFTTISVMLRRGARAADFDDVTALAVERIPLTLVASAPDANAETRAAVAIIATAANIVASAEPAAKQSSHRRTACEAALAPLFGTVTKLSSRWANPGIAEGCLRSLPTLAASENAKKLAENGIELLLQLLAERNEPDDFAAMHRRVLAHASLRMLLAALVERLHERFLEFPTATEENGYERNLDHAVALVLAAPTQANILKIFGPAYDPDEVQFEVPPSLSDCVIEAAASAHELLRQMESRYSCWADYDSPSQLLLTRILAAELRAASTEAREISRYPLLKKRLDTVSSVALTDEQRQEYLWKLLSRIPSAAAEAAHGDLQSFVEYRSGRPPARSGGKQERDLSDLPGFILAMIDESVSLRLARHIAREVDLNRRRARARDGGFDFAVQLHQVTLRGPSEKIFDHLLSRIEDPIDRKLVALFERHVGSVREAAHGTATIQTLVANVKRLLPDIEKHQNAAGERKSPTLDALVDVLNLYVRLAADDPSIWPAIVGGVSSGHGAPLDGGFHQLLEKLDAIATETHVRHYEAVDGDATDTSARQRLAVLCADACDQLRAEVNHYVDLPIKQFDERHRALNRASEAAWRIEKLLVAEKSLQPPEQILLRRLLEYWRDVFDRTKEWYVDAPRRCVETGSPETFWSLFAHGPADHVEPAVTPTDLGLSGSAPPFIEQQQEKFEQFYVDWMASELDIDHLSSALEERWEGWFTRVYRSATNLRHVIGFIALPFVVAAVLHPLELGHSMPGILFLTYALVGVGGAAYLMTRHIWRRTTSGAGESKASRASYLYECILPSLFRLIIVPFVLLVELEHSYVFPVEAAGIKIVLLMVLAFLSTNYFIRREVFRQYSARKGTPGPELKRRQTQVRKIVALALAQSFSLALFFSLVFEADTVSKHMSDGQTQAVDSSHEQSSSKHPDTFLNLIPRTAIVDLRPLMARFGYDDENAIVKVYPTVILTWTALGLFFGAFLEGFLRGERLRGEVSG